MSNQLSIEITDQELRILRFSPKPFLARGRVAPNFVFDCIPIPSGVIEQGVLRKSEVFMELLQGYLAQAKVSLPICVHLLIPFHLGFIRAYKLPWIAKRLRRSAIGFLIDEEVPIQAEDLLTDFVTLKEDRQANLLYILIGAARRSLIEHYVQAFGQVGLQVFSIDFTASVLGYSLGLDLDEDSLFLQDEGSALKMIIYCGIVPEVVRIFLPNSLLPVPSGEWESDIQRVLLYYGNQHPSFSLRRVLTTGGAVAELIAERLLKAGLVTNAQQANWTKLPDAWLKQYPEYPDKAKVVMGYALKVLAKVSGINLWHRGSGDKNKRLYYKMLLTASALGILLGLIAWLPLQTQENRLQIEVEQLRSRGSYIEVLSNQQKEMLSNWEKVSQHPFKVGERLTEIQYLPPLGIELTYLEYKEGGLSLRGTADKVEHFEELLKVLKSNGWDHPYLTSYKQTNQALIEFSLNAGHWAKQ